MNRRAFLTTLIMSPAVAAFLAACGDDSAGPAGTSPDGTTPGTTGGGGGIAHPTGAEEAVLRLGFEGGFMTADGIFSQSPSMVISGDGLVLAPGAVPAIYPGPLLMPYFQRTIDEAGTQTVLTAAKDAGLLASAPDYTLPDGIGIADAPDTVLVLAANGATYEHRAYALDATASDPNASTPARDSLAAFITKVSDLPTLVGAEHLGAETPYAPAAYRLRATPVEPPPAITAGTDSTAISEPQPTVTPWPADTGVVLAQASECVLADAAKVSTVLGQANQLSYFSEGAVTYQLTAVVVLPGDKPC